MQNTLGQLTTKVDRLIDDVRGHGRDLVGISQKINLFLGGAAVVGVVAGVMLTITMQIPWGRLFEPRNPEASGVRAIEQPAPQPQPQPQPKQ